MEAMATMDKKPTLASKLQITGKDPKRKGITDWQVQMHLTDNERDIQGAKHGQGCKCKSARLPQTTAAVNAKQGICCGCR